MEDYTPVIVVAACSCAGVLTLTDASSCPTFSLLFLFFLLLLQLSLHQSLHSGLPRPVSAPMKPGAGAAGHTCLQPLFNNHS